MTIDNPEGIGADEPLSLMEAASAYANLGNDEEADSGQSDSEQDAEDDAAELSLDEDGSEPDEEGQAEDDENEPAAPAYASDDAKVKLADGTEITIAELKQGSLRDRDYRQKTMELAEQKRSYDSKAEQIQQFEQQLAGDRDFMVQLLQSIMPQKPDPSMYSVDPLGYGEQKAIYDARKEQLDYLIQQNQQLAQRRQAEEQESFQHTREREWLKTLEKMPELGDSKRLQSFVSEVQRHASEYGYSPQEISQVGLDHRQVLVLRDAIAWRKLQASKSKVAAKVEGRPPVQRGGTRPTAEGARARDARVAMDRLKSSGSLRDGVAALLALEKG